MHRRDWRDFWAFDEFGGLHRLGAIRVVSAGRRLRQRRIHPGASDGDSRGRQAALDERIGSGRRRARLGPAKSGGEARAQEHSGSRAILFSGRVVSEVRKPCAARYRHAGDPPHCVSGEAGDRWASGGVSGCDAYPARDAGSQAGRHSGDLRKVSGHRPARRAHEGFSGNALHDGWFVGERPGPSNECAGNLRRGGMRVSVSRGEPLGSELTGVVHFWRRDRRARRGEVCAEPGQGSGNDGIERLCAGAKAAGGDESSADLAARLGKSHHHLEGAWRDHDGARDRDAHQ